MLTEKQRDVVELYYNEDLSLSEIAAHSQITRQGVRDSIKRAEGILLGLEERLGLAKRFRRIQEGLDLIIRDARDIRNYNDRFGTFREITDKTNEIIEIAKHDQRLIAINSWSKGGGAVAFEVDCPASCRRSLKRCATRGSSKKAISRGSDARGAPRALEADVNYKVAKDFVAAVTEKAVGDEGA